MIEALDTPEKRAKALCVEFRQMGEPADGAYLGVRQSGVTLWDADHWPLIERRIASAIKSAIEMERREFAPRQALIDPDMISIFDPRKPDAARTSGGAADG